MCVFSVTYFRNSTHTHTPSSHGFCCWCRCSCLCSCLFWPAPWLQCFSWLMYLYHPKYQLFDRVTLQNICSDIISRNRMRICLASPIEHFALVFWNVSYTFSIETSLNFEMLLKRKKISNKMKHFFLFVCLFHFINDSVIDFKYILFEEKFNYCLAHFFYSIF